MSVENSPSEPRSESESGPAARTPSPEQELSKELSARSGRGVGKLTLVLVGAVLVVAGFAGGIVFNKATATAGTADGPGSSPGQGFNGPGQGGVYRTPGADGQGDMPPGGGGLVAGTITSVSGDTVTVKLSDGTTKQVKTTGSTTVTMSEKGTVEQLKSGDTVVVRGEEGSDGKVEAESIAEGETGFARGGRQGG